MNLTRVERGVPAGGERDHEPSLSVDAAGATATTGPGELAPAQGVARAVGVEDCLGRLREPAIERIEQPHERGLDLIGRLTKGGGGGTQLGGKVGQPDGDVQTDAEDGPAILRAGLGEDARELGKGVGGMSDEDDVVGPLYEGVGPGDVADGDGSDQRQERRGEPRSTSEASREVPGGADQRRP